MLIFREISPITAIFFSLFIFKGRTFLSFFSKTIPSLAAYLFIPFIFLHSLEEQVLDVRLNPRLIREFYCMDSSFQDQIDQVGICNVTIVMNIHTEKLELLKLINQSLNH